MRQGRFFYVRRHAELTVPPPLRLEGVGDLAEDLCIVVHGMQTGRPTTV